MQISGHRTLAALQKYEAIPISRANTIAAIASRYIAKLSRLAFLMPKSLNSSIVPLQVLIIKDLHRTSGLRNHAAINLSGETTLPLS